MHTREEIVNLFGQTIINKPKKVGKKILTIRYTNLDPGFMPHFPSMMRTGRSTSETVLDDNSLSEWLRFMEAVFLAFAQKGYEIACQYAEAAGRGRCATPTDCVYGLKYAARTFLNEDDFENRTLSIQSIMNQCDFERMEEGNDNESSSECEDNESSSECEEGEYTDESRDEYQAEDEEVIHRGRISDEMIDRVLYYDDDTSDMIVLDDSEIPPFCRAPETSDWVIRVHEVVDGWNDWRPTDPIEQLLKQSISITDDTEHMERERERHDVAFRRRRSRSMRL